MYIIQKFKRLNMNHLKSLVFLFILSFLFIKATAQTDSKDVTIKASGSGKTLEEAKQAALRSATEQAFGAFISSKTEMFNDSIVADQMASVSSGNIKSYESLNETQLPDGRWAVTLKTVVSVDKLTSFVQSKGISVEVKGGMFAMNIKQQLLNEQGEMQAITEMVGLLHEPMQTAFDYTIKSGEPKSLDDASKNWAIPLVVNVTTNKNIEICENYLIKTLSAISLNDAEVKSYLSLNKDVYLVKIFHSGSGSEASFYLRKRLSLNAIYSLISNWRFYVQLFTVKSDADTITGIWEPKIKAFGAKSDDDDRALGIKFYFAGDSIGSYSFVDKRSLAQIEKMNGYSVMPDGVLSEFKNGGYLVNIDDEHSLIVALCDIGEFNLTDARRICDELVLNGYDDWRLPKIDELKFINDELKSYGIGALEKACWSSTIGTNVTCKNCGSEIAVFDFTERHKEIYDGINANYHKKDGFFYIHNSNLSRNGYQEKFHLRPVRFL